MVLRAAKIWEIPEEDVEYKEAVLQHKSDPELKLTFKQIAARMIPTGGPIVGSAGVNPLCRSLPGPWRSGRRILHGNRS